MIGALLARPVHMGGTFDAGTEVGVIDGLDRGLWKLTG